MRWFDRFIPLPIVGSRRARAELVRKLELQRQEIVRLRARVESQARRLAEEKRKQRRLEARLARQKTAAPPAPKPLSPRQQAFQHATDADGYRFATVVSYPKSGRTWFSTIYFHYARRVLRAEDMIQQSLHMPDRNVAFQRLLAEKGRSGAFPICVFTHLGFSAQKPFELVSTPWPDKASAVLKRPTVLIVRDPRDVVVSHYHHLRAVGGVLDSELSLTEFIRGAWGIERIVRFMNMWAAAMRAHHANLHLCTFESLKRDTAGTFSTAMTFLGTSVDQAAVASAVDESSFDRLKDRERSNRAYQGASLEPDAFRFRRGAVGGHVQELSESDAEYLNDVVATQLNPIFAMYVSASIEHGL